MHSEYDTLLKSGVGMIPTDKTCSEKLNCVFSSSEFKWKKYDAPVDTVFLSIRYKSIPYSKFLFEPHLQSAYFCFRIATLKLLSRDPLQNGGKV